PATAGESRTCRSSYSCDRAATVLRPSCDRPPTGLRAVAAIAAPTKDGRGCVAEKIVGAALAATVGTVAAIAAPTGLWLSEERALTGASASGRLCRLLVRAALGEHGQLVVGGLLFLEGGFQQRQRVVVAELAGQRAQRAVGGDLVVLGLLRAADQCGVADGAGFDFIDHFLALFHQAFHRHALHALELDAEHLDHLVDAFDLTQG